MKTFKFTVLICVLFITQVFAQAPDTLWTRIYTPGWVVSAVCVDSTNNIIITGPIEWLIVKYSPDGDIVWEKEYNFPGEGSQDITVDQQDNIIIAGQYDDDIMTIKCNSNGDTLWTRKYDSGSIINDDHAFGVAVDTAGNIIVVGYIWGPDDTWDIITIKYNSNGDTSWVRTYSGDGDGDEQAYGVATDKEGNIIVTGRNEGILTIKYSPQGNRLWVREYFNSVTGLDVAVDTCSNIIVAGTRLIKYTPNGDTLWTRYVSTSAFSVAVYENGDFVTTGYHALYDSIVTKKYTSNGDSLWTTIYDSDYDDVGYGIAIDGEDNIIVTGGIYNGGFDFLTIKYEADLEVKETVEGTVASQGMLFSTFPNPFTNQMQISYTLARNMEIDLSIYDILGAKVTTLEYGYKKSGYHSIIWDRKNDRGNIVPSGIYFCCIEMEGFISTKKMVILD